MNAAELRETFLGFFAAREHRVVPSASLIPHDPTVLFTVAGMVPFKPFFVGDESPPTPRATSAQKCLRTVDIDIIGSTARHLTFFEMLGNFSFGDYFKSGAIAFHWELVTEVLGLDPEQLWITVHDTDDEAEQIWADVPGVSRSRIQRMGEDNFWAMGPTGPCGPCSEIYFDKGASYGEEGGPLHGGAERYVEICNLVFMQNFRHPDGSLTDLPRKNIDTGSGLERLLTVLDGVDSVYDTDALAPVLAAAQSLTGVPYGRSSQTDVSLRILADHARAVTHLIADGVFPSNEERGYVLRRLLRRMVRHAHTLGVNADALVPLVSAVVDHMASAYPNLAKQADFISGVVDREEERFRKTLASGSALLDEELAKVGSGSTLDGETAFRLHDTFGFPLELTRELAAEAGIEIDEAGFESAMDQQRTRAKAAHASAGADDEQRDRYRAIVETFGPTAFLGYVEHEAVARVVGVVARAEEPAGAAGEGATASKTVELFVDRTPFYAESGGQVGDTGEIVGPMGRATVLDTTYALTGLTRHVALVEGEFTVGDEVTLRIDSERREAIRRNHTATHLLHGALREVLGSHVKQAGSLVAPDRLRFDFNHFQAVSTEELREIEDLVNSRILTAERVDVAKMSKVEAESAGAIAFFGEKYGDEVRVVRAGSHSIELCGGTHVEGLGMIGQLTILGESSIGANIRRIEGVTGYGAVAHRRLAQERLGALSTLLRAAPEEVVDRVSREIEERKSLERELAATRRELARFGAAELAATAISSVDGKSRIVVARHDGGGRDDLRDLAVAVREQPGVGLVVLIGAPDGGGVALVAAVDSELLSLVPHELLAPAARLTGGGGGKAGDLATAGGRDPDAIPAALDLVRGTLVEQGVVASFEPPLSAGRASG